MRSCPCQVVIVAVHTRLLFTRMQDLDPNNADAKEDLLFISQLVQQQTAQLVGLPGLDVVANPCE